MKRLSILLILLILIALPVTAQMKGNAKDLEEIKSIAVKWQDAWNRHRLKELSAFVTEDVDFIAVSGRWRKGRKEFEEHHTNERHEVAYIESVWTTKNTEVRFVKSDVAVAIVEWGIKGDKDPDGTPRQPRQGIATWVVEKRQGKWLIISIQNTNLREPVPAIERVSDAQTKPEQIRSGPDKNKPETIALKSGEPPEFTYDAGTVRYLASSEDTNGAWSLVEVKEMPGYKTNLHRHNNTDEAFYVLEGVLTIKINDKTSEYPVGSYVLVPRGTPHAQGNFGKVPVRLLLTVTPSGFEQSFRDRVELFKSVKPDDPNYRKMREELTKKNKIDVERLGEWVYKK